MCVCVRESVCMCVCYVYNCICVFTCVVCANVVVLGLKPGLQFELLSCTKSQMENLGPILRP